MIAIISDVHANLRALLTVMEDILGKGIERIIFLGDAVGYGQQPNECLEILKMCEEFIAGNHDWAAIGLISTEGFNADARESIETTKKIFNSANYQFLKTRKLIKYMKKDNICIVHATPRAPQAWMYLTSLEEAKYEFGYFDEQICFIGHSHVPFIIEQSTRSGKTKYCSEFVKLAKGKRYIVNVGSVGQPRDKDGKATYAIATNKSVEIVRVAFSSGRHV
ncbi:MAG: metallophosphoesterase family protein [Nitrospirae bacterium]|nr:metallophosphoesterase family protein [Nitrospirota bacterium]